MRLRNRDVFSLRSPYAPAAVLGLLRGCTATGRGGGGGGDPVLFTGDLPYGGNTFVLRPACHGRNSWLPVLRCALAPEGSGAILRVDAQCWWFIRGFMAVWYAMLALITLMVLTALLLDGFDWGMLGIPACWIFGYVLPHFAFWRPMDRAKRDLCRILQGDILEN